MNALPVFAFDPRCICVACSGAYISVIIDEMKKRNSLSQSAKPDDWKSPQRMRLFFRYVVTKDESDFGDAANLVGIGAGFTKGSARGIAAGVCPGNVAAKEEATILEGGRRGDRGAGAAWAEHQVDGLVGRAAGSRDVFHSSWKREAVFKGVAN